MAKHTCEEAGCKADSRTCRVCGSEKSLTDFHKDSSKHGGHRYDCKDCARARSNEYSHANRDKRIEYMRQYNAENRDRINAYNKASYRNNAKKRREESREHYWSNRDRILPEQRRRRAENLESYRLRERAYNEANREKRREYGRVNDKRRRAEDEKYQASRNASYLRRRRMLADAPQEPYLRREIFERDGWKCHLCGHAIDKSLKWPNVMSASIDHVMPLSLGGGDTPSNVKAAHVCCNAARGAKPLREVQ